MNKELVKMLRILYKLPLSNKNFSKSADLVNHIVSKINELDQVIIK